MTPANPSESSQDFAHLLKAMPGFLFDFRFSRSSGPGGQNVNKLNTRATLRINLDDLAHYLPQPVMHRLEQIAKPHIHGRTLIIDDQQTRSQQTNRESASDRFVELLRKAHEKPRRRKRTCKPRAAEHRRLEMKKQNAQRKAARQYRPDLNDRR